MGVNSVIGRMVLIATAIAGVAAGHSATYVVAFRDLPSRLVALQDSGHTHWPELAAGGVLLALLAAAVVMLRHLRSRPLPVVGTGSIPRLVAPLVILQSVAFVSLEVSERAAVGWPIGAFTDHHFLAIIAVGILIQGVVALMGALALRLLAGAADLLARWSRGDLPGSFPVAPRAPVWLQMPSSLRLGAWGVRGPPPR